MVYNEICLANKKKKNNFLLINTRSKNIIAQT